MKISLDGSAKDLLRYFVKPDDVRINYIMPDHISAHESHSTRPGILTRYSEILLNKLRHAHAMRMSQARSFK